MHGRLTRLSWVGATFLLLITVLAATRTTAQWWIVAMLGSGWLTMTPSLLATRHNPRHLSWVLVPSGLVATGLVGLCITALPAAMPARVGWIMLTVGIWLGVALGLWLWFRLAPIPEVLRDPVGPGRWALITLHVAPILLAFGLLLSAS